MRYAILTLLALYVCAPIAALVLLPPVVWVIAHTLGPIITWWLTVWGVG